ncbi:hypothetical protein, partial [Pseudomonas rubra]
VRRTLTIKQTVGHISIEHRHAWPLLAHRYTPSPQALLPQKLLIETVHSVVTFAVFPHAPRIEEFA